MDNPVNQRNDYPVDSMVCFINTYPLHNPGPENTITIIESMPSNPVRESPHSTRHLSLVIHL